MKTVVVTDVQPPLMYHYFELLAHVQPAEPQVPFGSDSAVIVVEFVAAAGVDSVALAQLLGLLVSVQSR